ncbi:hypothetical protein PUR_05650 [Paenibacillus sp. URB8-2]|nr:hypothetical protein [Paenibacillus sp. URB8-2]BCG57140.1 hypothetical protein PUR_05650 [Paenibacillus sp. URB8-2]
MNGFAQDGANAQGGTGAQDGSGAPGGTAPDGAAQDGANAQDGTGAPSDDGAGDSRSDVVGQFAFDRNGGESVNESLVAYLKEHNTGQKYLFATMNYSTGGPYIIEGNKVVILNGFSGSDVVYTTDTLAALVKSGQVKYFYVSGGGMGGGREGNSSLTAWITENGTEITASEWQGTSGTASGTLYEVTLN